MNGEQVRLQPGDALILVDVQRDFCPGGSLPIQEGHAVVPILNRWIADAIAAGVPIFASRDWHPPGHVSFRPAGGAWPVHCVQESEGANFHPDLRMPPDATIITKGDRTDRDQYSAFDETGLAEMLRQRGIRCVWIGGLAQDVCVRATALDAVKEGFEARLIRDATRPVSPEAGKAALKDMSKAGVVIHS